MKHGEDIFQGRKNFKLFYRSWLPDGKIKAILIISHGVAEHCGRYAQMAEYFAGKGFAVYSFDYRGHGKSEGKRGYIEHFSYYVDDLQTFCRIVCSLHPYKKAILFGHSMGAIIDLAEAIHNQHEFCGLILSGTAIKIKPDLPVAILAMLKPVSLFLPALGLKKIDSSTLSRDEGVVRSYNNDNLVYRGKLSARLGIELAWLIHKLRRQLSEIEIPVLLLHGGEDKLSFPEGARLVFERISSKDKTLNVYAGLYHEILNEPENIQVFSDIEMWLSHLT